jgi:hypothetical protein
MMVYAMQEFDLIAIAMRLDAGSNSITKNSAHPYTPYFLKWLPWLRLDKGRN